jgi:hypothetical protein
MTIGHDETGVRVPPAKVDATPDAIELLIKEARDRARHRRIAEIVAAIVVASSVIALVVALRDSTTSPTAPSGSHVLKVSGLAEGPIASLKLAGPLTVSPNGTLYVVDVAEHRVLERLLDGRFRVVAGDGRSGYSGDGGPAYRAELSNVTDLAFGPQNDLYIADGGRVRVVGEHGIIRTIAGNGMSQSVIANGTPAISAALGSSLYIAISPTGHLIISTGTPLLRVTAIGSLETIRAVVTSGPLKGPLDRNLGPVTIDNRGDLYVSGFNGWSLWRIRPNGIATFVGSARQNGGNYAVLVRSDDGVVYDENGSVINLIRGDHLSKQYSFTTSLRGQYFWLTNFALGPHGVAYADDIWGGVGFEAHQQLVALRHNRVSVLWQESGSEHVSCVTSCS